MAFIARVAHKRAQRPFITHTFTAKLSRGGGKARPKAGMLWPRGQGRA